MFDADTDAAATGTHSLTLNKWLVKLKITTDADITSTAYDKITKLYVWIKATDAHGNTKEYKFPIWHDPQGDRPSVTIDYPLNDARLGGTVRLAGNATGNNAPTAVFVQILRDEHTVPSGSPTVTDLNYWQSKGYPVYLMSGSSGTAWAGTLAPGQTAANYGILATLNGGSWSLTINENGEFNPSGNTPNNVKITAYAYGASHNKSLPKSVNVTFDKNNPVFGNIQLVKSTNENLSTANSAQQTTASGGTYSVKDTWYIYGSVTDADTIKKLMIKDGSTTHTLITGGTASSSSGLWNVTNAGNTATFKYKLDTASGVGECPIEIEAYDATSQEYNSKYTLTIKYDNQAPVLLMPSETGYNIKADVSQSDSFYTFGSKVKEDAVGRKAQSGFKRLAFFFMRRSSASNAVIYDPMLEKSDSLNKHAWNAAGISYDSGLYWKAYSGVTWSATNPAVLTFTTDKNVHEGGLVQADGAIYRIQSVSNTGTGITLDSALAANPGTTVKVALALIVDHLSAEGGVSSLEADGYYSPGHMINDDGDRMIESVSKTGTTWTWEASICSRNIPDGPIELHYAAFDEAGNYSVGVVGNVDYTTFQGYSTDDKSDPHLQVSAYAYDSAKPAFVSNNRPRIAGVTFGTDYNGNNAIEDGEKITAYRAHQTKGEYDANHTDNVWGITSITGFKGTGSSDKVVYDPNGKQKKDPNLKAEKLKTELTLDIEDKMTVRGYTEITPEIVGGNGAIYYEYDLPVIGNGVNTASPLIASGTTDYTIAEGTITLQLGDILKLSGTAESTKELKFTFWDSTEGAALITASGTDWQKGRQKASLNVNMKFAGKTPAAPKTTIAPFYWNSESDNSLFGNSRENGHLEVESGLPTTFGSNSGAMDRDPKVSGQIVMRGTAHDNSFIDGLYISVPGMESVFENVTPALEKVIVNYTDSSVSPPVSKSIDCYKIADGSSGHLTGTDKWSDGFKFECPAADQTIGKSGHDVNWTFSWDTSKITGVAKTDVEVHVLAYNKGEPTCTSVSAGDLSVDGTTHYAAATYNNPKGDTPSTAQTTAGTLTNRYRMDVVPYVRGIENKVGEGLSNSVIRGSDGSYSMNYSTSEKMIVKGFNLGPASGGTTTATIGSTSLAVSDVTETSIKVSKKASTGALVVKVGTIESINNKVDITKPYNQEKNITNPSSNLWSAKRELVFWENKQVCTSKTDQTFYYPSMIMSGNQPIFAYCNNNDGYTWRTINDDTSAKRTGIWYARNAVLVKTADGHYIHASNEDNFSSNEAGYLYVALNDTTENAEINARHYNGAELVELCGVDWNGTPNGGDSDKRYLNRFKFPNLIADGNITDLQIYVSYYEARQKQIQFFAFKTTRTGSGTFVDPYEYGTNLSMPTRDYQIASNGNLAVPNTTGGNSSEHTAMAKVDTGIYIAYYDANSTTLKLAYSKAPLLTSGLADTAAAWDTLEVDNGTLTGQYVSMAAAGTKLYIAYHDASNAALKLAVIDTTKENDTTHKLDENSITSKVIVDAYQSVGYKTGITMVNGLPYISYYNNAQAGTKSTIKLAYPKDAAAIAQAGAETSGAFTGNWIARYIPSVSVPNVGIPEFNRVMIDNYTESGTNKPVLAWLGEPFIEYTKMK